MDHISPKASDIELIQCLRAGYPDALTILYDRYRNLVYRVALGFLKQPAEAEDLMQDVFLNFWKHNTFDPSRATLRTYLCIMTRSRSLNQLSSNTSRRHSLKRLQQLFLNCSNVTPLETASLAEQQDVLQQALTQLSDQQHQILDMNFYQGLSHTEIAKRLKMPLGTVKTKARNGLKNLRPQLENSFNER